MAQKIAGECPCAHPARTCTRPSARAINASSPLNVTLFHHGNRALLHPGRARAGPVVGLADHAYDAVTGFGGPTSGSAVRK